MAKTVQVSDCLSEETVSKWVVSPGVGEGIVNLQFPDGKNVPGTVELDRWTAAKMEGVQLGGVPDDGILTTPAVISGGRLTLSLTNEARGKLSSGGTLTVIDYYR